MRRTRIGGLTADAALPLAAVEAALEAEGGLDALLIPANEALSALPEVRVAADVARGVRHGVPFPRAAMGGDIPVDGPFRIVDDGDELLAVYRADGNRVAAEVVTA